MRTTGEHCFGPSYLFKPYQRKQSFIYESVYERSNRNQPHGSRRDRAGEWKPRSEQQWHLFTSQLEVKFIEQWEVLRILNGA